MYKLRLSLLAVLCVSALNAGDEEKSVVNHNTYNCKVTLLDGKVIGFQPVKYIVAKELADNWPIVDALPKGLKDNCITNNIYVRAIASNKWVQMVVSKKAVDRGAYAGGIAGLSQWATGKDLNDPEVQKEIALEAAIAYGLAQAHVMLSGTRVADYINTDSKLINDGVCFAAHLLINKLRGTN